MKKTLLATLVAASFAVPYASAETVLGGTVSTTYRYTNSGDDANGNAITDSSLNNTDGTLTLSHKFNDKVDAYLAYAGNDGIALDEARVNIHPTKNTDISLGKFDTGFIKNTTNFITDSLVDQYADASMNAGVKVTQRFGNGLSGSVYGFESEQNKVLGGAPGEIGGSVDYSNGKYSAGVGLISAVKGGPIDGDLAAAVNTNNATQVAALANPNIDYSRTDLNEWKGANVYGTAQLGKVKLIGEYFTVTDKIYNTLGEKVQPEAAQVEVQGKIGRGTAAFTYQEGQDLEYAPNYVLGTLPDSRYGVSYTTTVYNNLSIGSEVLVEKPHSFDGSEQDDRTTFAVKVGYSF